MVIEGFYTTSAGKVLPTPNGVMDDIGGMTLNGLSLAAGYWRASINSTEILPCLDIAHCKGGTNFSSYCTSGYKGPLCAVCNDGYAAVGSGESLSCNECTGSSLSTILCGIGFLLVVLLLALYYHFREGSVRKKTSKISKRSIVRKIGPIIKVTFAYFQIVGGLAFVFGFKFPPFFSQLVSWEERASNHINTVRGCCNIHARSNMN